MCQFCGTSGRGDGVSVQCGSQFLYSLHTVKDALPNRQIATASVNGGPSWVNDRAQNKTKPDSQTGLHRLMCSCRIFLN